MKHLVYVVQNSFSACNALMIEYCTVNMCNCGNSHRVCQPIIHLLSFSYDISLFVFILLLETNYLLQSLFLQQTLEKMLRDINEGLLLRLNSF